MVSHLHSGHNLHVILVVKLMGKVLLGASTNGHLSEVGDESAILLTHDVPTTVDAISFSAPHHLTP